jgi:hypothetical protein
MPPPNLFRDPNEHIQGILAQAPAGINDDKNINLPPADTNQNRRFSLDNSFVGEYITLQYSFGKYWAIQAFLLISRNI